MSCSLDTAKRYLMRKGAIDGNMVIKLPLKVVNNLVNILTATAKRNYHVDRGPLFTIVQKRVNDYVSENRLVANQAAFGDIDESGLVRQAITPYPRMIEKVQLKERGTQEEPYFEIWYDGSNVGFISTQNDGSYLTTELASLSDTQQGKGIGTTAYVKLAQLAQERSLQLRSDNLDGRMSEAAIGLWERFVRTGQAEKSGNYYIFVQNLQDQQPESNYKPLESEEDGDLPALDLKC